MSSAKFNDGGSSITPQEPQALLTKPDLARPLRRLYAYAIDIGILLMVVYLVAPIAGGRVFSREAAIADVFIFFGYFVITTGIFGRTPGKWVAGIKVVDGEGLQPGVAVAIPREMVGRFVSIAAIGIGMAWLLWDPNRQGWHDKIAGTFVVNDRSGGPGWLSRLLSPASKTDSNKEKDRRAKHRVGRPARRRNHRRRSGRH